jgi:hypothetical protein
MAAAIADPLSWEDLRELLPLQSEEQLLQLR